MESNRNTQQRDTTMTSKIINTATDTNFVKLTCSCCGSNEVIAVGQYRIYECAKGCKATNKGAKLIAADRPRRRRKV